MLNLQFIIPPGGGVELASGYQGLHLVAIFGVIGAISPGGQGSGVMLGVVFHVKL